MLESRILYPRLKRISRTNITVSSIVRYQATSPQVFPPRTKSEMEAPSQRLEERRGLAPVIHLTITQGIPIIHKNSMGVGLIRAFRNALIIRSSWRRPMTNPIGGSTIEARIRKSCILGERARKWLRTPGQAVVLADEEIEGRRYRGLCIHTTR